MRPKRNETERNGTKRKLALAWPLLPGWELSGRWGRCVGRVLHRIPRFRHLVEGAVGAAALEDCRSGPNRAEPAQPSTRHGGRLTHVFTRVHETYPGRKQTGRGSKHLRFHASRAGVRPHVSTWSPVMHVSRKMLPPQKVLLARQRCHLRGNRHRGKEIAFEGHSPQQQKRSW